MAFQKPITARKKVLFKGCSKACLICAQALTSSLESFLGRVLGQMFIITLRCLGNSYCTQGGGGGYLGAIRPLEAL